MSLELQVLLLDPNATHDDCRIATDSAFPVARQLYSKIVTPLKDGDLEKYPPNLHAGVIAVSNAITSLRQAGEWGMGAVPKVYRQLQLPLPYNPHVRGRRLENMFRLYNFRVRRTGISQIRNVFFE